MKLRLEKDKITIRLAPSEIENFVTKKYLEEKLYISKNNRFAFALSISETSQSCVAEFKPDALQVVVPVEKVNKWINSKQVGIKETIVTISGDEIVLTLEEDLPPRKNKKKN